MNRGWLKPFSMTLGVATLVACGSSDMTAGIDRGGATRVSVIGPITGFGSIVVNGVHYAVDHAAVQVDGEVGTVADLELGQVVTLVGERDAGDTTGTADTVSFQTNVRGPVDAIDDTTSALTVLGQTVTVGSATVFDLGSAPAGFGSIQEGDFVSVSGFVGADGSIAATRVESATASRGLLVLGVVSNLNAFEFQFNLGALVVDYRQPALIEGFASGGPSNGDRVVVRGTSLDSNDALVATEVRHVVEQRPGAGGEAEVEGLITRFVSPTDFDVADRSVTTTASTQYFNGTPGALGLNVRVEVEGTADMNGTIVATRVEIEH